MSTLLYITLNSAIRKINGNYSNYSTTRRIPLVRPDVNFRSRKNLLYSVIESLRDSLTGSDIAILKCKLLNYHWAGVATATDS